MPVRRVTELPDNHPLNNGMVIIGYKPRRPASKKPEAGNKNPTHSPNTDEGPAKK